MVSLQSGRHHGGGVGREGRGLKLASRHEGIRKDIQAKCFQPGTRGITRNTLALSCRRDG